MGCSPSKESVPGTDGEVFRKGVPARIEVVVSGGSAAWRSCTVGKQLSDEQNIFEVRVDNGGGTLTVTLKKPGRITMKSSKLFAGVGVKYRPCIGKKLGDRGGN